MSVDPATGRDKAQALLYIVLLMGIIVTLLVAFCLTAHERMTH